MRKMISLVFMIFAAGVLLQGCYTILDLPEISIDEYMYTPEPEQPYDPGPVPIPIPPRPPIYYPPIVNPIIIEQPLVTPNPKIDRNKDTQMIRDNGNGRGNSGRNTGFNNSTITRTETNSSINSNSSSNSDNTQGSGNSRNIKR